MTKGVSRPQTASQAQQAAGMFLNGMQHHHYQDQANQWNHVPPQDPYKPQGGSDAIDPHTGTNLRGGREQDTSFLSGDSPPVPLKERASRSLRTSPAAGRPYTERAGTVMTAKAAEVGPLREPHTHSSRRSHFDSRGSGGRPQQHVHHSDTLLLPQAADKFRNQKRNKSLGDLLKERAAQAKKAVQSTTQAVRRAAAFLGWQLGWNGGTAESRDPSHVACLTLVLASLHLSQAIDARHKAELVVIGPRPSKASHDVRALASAIVT